MNVHLSLEPMNSAYPENAVALVGEDPGPGRSAARLQLAGGRPGQAVSVPVGRQPAREVAVAASCRLPTGSTGAEVRAGRSGRALSPHPGPLPRGDGEREVRGGVHRRGWAPKAVGDEVTSLHSGAIPTSHFRLPTWVRASLRRLLRNGLALLLGLGSAMAADYAMARHTFAGGAASSGGNFAVRGSIGQAVAGPVSGPGATVQGGFWNLLTLPSLLAPAEDAVEFLANRSVKVPLATLVANDRSLLGYGLTVVAVDPVTANGGTVTIAGRWLVYTPPAGPAANDSFHYTLSDGQPGAQHTVTGMVRLNLETPNPNDGPAPNAAHIAWSGDDVTITFIGVPFREYRVQYTEDTVPPLNWQEFVPTAAHAAAANGVFVHTDANPGSSLRLYRAIANP